MSGLLVDASDRGSDAGAASLFKPALKREVAPAPSILPPAVKRAKKAPSEKEEVKPERADTESSDDSEEEEDVPRQQPEGVELTDDELDDDDAPASRSADKKKKKVVESDEAAAERLSRTIYVGNLPPTASIKAVKKHFAASGKVESARFRAAAAANPKMSQRAAVITGELTGDAISAYVVFAERAGAVRAAATSGQVVFGRHLRVDAAAAAGEGSASSKLHDTRRSVFLGNLPHDITDEALWSLFEPCGRVAYVRIVREKRTQIGKGFGYVGFHEAGAVERALLLHGTKVLGAAGDAGSGAPPASGKSGAAEGADKKADKGRAMRVFRCSSGKSHARLTAQAEGAADAKQRKGVGWQQRVRRRLHKKLDAKASVRAGGAGTPKGATERAMAAAARVGKQLTSAIAKRAKFKGGRGGGGGSGKGGKAAASTTAKAKRESKARQLAKRARSKVANGKKKASPSAAGGSAAKQRAK